MKGRRRTAEVVRAGAVWLLAGLLVASPRAQEVRHGVRLPRVEGFLPLAGDLHLHSVFSDGDVWPTVHVREAWRDGLDVVSLTEHREYRPHAADLAGGAIRAYELARPVAEQLGVVLLTGVEITRPEPGRPSAWPVGSAHFTAFFIKDDGPLDAPDLSTALRLARDQGAFVAWAHPGFMDRQAQWYPHVDDVHRQGLFQGIEIVNGDQYSPEAFGWALDKHLAILACSDAHLPMPAHLRSARRPVTILFARSRDAEGVRNALIERRTAAWLDDEVWGAERWVRGLWDGAVRPGRATPARAGQDFVVPLENATSIDFRLAFPAGPVSLAHPTLIVHAGATTLLHGRVPGDFTPGTRQVEIPLAIENLHPRPGEALSTVLTVELEVGE